MNQRTTAHKDNEEKEVEELAEQLKSAYRKYKTNTYYNNYEAIQRAELAKFEFETFNEGLYSECLFHDCEEDECVECENNNVKTSLNKDITDYKRNITDYFKKLAETLINKESRNNFFKQILKKIGIIAFPKKMKDNKKDNEEMVNILSNFREEKYTIRKAHYFISLPVEAHIVGALWILRCGWALDDKLHKHCFGNRINKFVLDSIKNNVYEDKIYSEFTPFLFDGYFKNYQLWRDQGLNQAKDMLKSGKNSIVISLDLKDYYYGATVDFSKLKKDIDCSKQKVFDNFPKNKKNIENLKNKHAKIDNHLTDFIKDIYEKYTEYFERKNYEKNIKKPLPLIPLGFLPSLIISNWNLIGLDQTILENIHPEYYGRYVDDILIVLPSHAKSSFHGEQSTNLPTSDIINKYLTSDGSEPKNTIFKLIKNNNISTKIENIKNELNNRSSNDIEPEKLISELKKINSKKNYRVCNQKHKCECENSNKEEYIWLYENLVVQSKKIKLFVFSNENSDAMITKFKQQIHQNTSEFRLMYEVERIFTDVKDDVYSISYEESENKLRDINEIKVNKFKLSKTLHKLLRTLIYDNKDENQDNEEDIVKEIIDSFNGHILDFMILWEKLITFIYLKETNEKFPSHNSILEIQTKKILKTIEKLEFNSEDDFTYGFKYDEKKLIKKTLKEYLYYTFARIFSLKNKQFIEIDKFFNHVDFNPKPGYNHVELSKYFLSSSLHNNMFMGNPLISCENLEPKYDLTKHQIRTKDFKGFAYPRFVHFHECVLHCINNKLDSHLNEEKIDKKYNKELNPESYLKLACEYYYKLNWNKKNRNCYENNFYSLNCNINCHNLKSENGHGECAKNDNIHVIKTGNYKKKKIKVGLINTKLNHEIFVGKIKGNSQRSSKRLDKIAKLINDAIDKKIELLIMPEMYIPYEWAEYLIHMSRMHQMAIIFGVENIISNYSVGNYIAMTLPSKSEQGHKNSAFIMRLKNHYSPHEIKEYKRRNLDYAQYQHSKYFLSIWNDIYIVPYYCYEIADIHDRSIFKNCCDIVAVSEFNQDANYFNNIAESLTRDLFCYCVKVNSSEFGGTCILQPTSSETKYSVQLKGGEDDYIVSHEIDIESLRNAQIQNAEVENDEIIFKPHPPGIDIDIIRSRMGLISYKKP
ncbi:MAG: hypothetical protein LBU74_08340 [Methanobacteriaceae archaeon]|jgi:hypothetical protein|nr:hypothetical protein [Candidatus Methanorudis spinitermitis]